MNGKQFNSALLLVLLFINSGVIAQEVEYWPWQSNNGSDLSILLFGDTNIQDRKHPVDAFRYVLPTFNKADLRIGNLEGPFAGTSRDPKLPDIPHKKGWKHSEPEMVKGLVDANIDVVSVANNVTYPWMALMKSIRVLQENGIPYAGGGKNIADAHKPVILEKKGTKIGFLAYACTVFPFQHAATENIPGIASMRIHTYYQPPMKFDKPGTPPVVKTVADENELELMKSDISNLKSKVDIVIASYHWGRSHHTELIDYQIEVAHAAIAAGADIIMGHGNHELGAVEVWNGKPIFYGLGNFVFDWYKITDRTDGLLVKVDIINGDMQRVSLVPLKRDEKNYAYLLDPTNGDGAALFNKVRERSGNLSSLVIEGKEVKVKLN